MGIGHVNPVDNEGFVHFTVEKTGDLEILVTVLWDSKDLYEAWALEAEVPTWESIDDQGWKDFVRKSDSVLENANWRIESITATEV